MRKIVFYTISALIYIGFWSLSVYLAYKNLLWLLLVFVIGIMFIPAPVAVFLFQNAHTRVTNIRSITSKQTAFACGHATNDFKWLLRICMYISYVALAVLLVMNFKHNWRLVFLPTIIELQIYSHVRCVVSVFRKTVFGFSVEEDYSDYPQIVGEFAASIGLKNFRLV